MSHFPIIFNDGKQGYHKGHVIVDTATVFDAFLKQVSSRIPGLDPQHFHIVIVCSRAGAPADARQHIPIHENTNFCVILSQHGPGSDRKAYFLVTLKRPEQRQLDQQRKMLHQQHQQQQQQQQQQHRMLECMDDQGQGVPQPALRQQGVPQPALQLPPNVPQQRQGGLTGAAYPWAGRGHPSVTPQIQQAWNAAQDPANHHVQERMGKRQDDSERPFCSTARQCPQLTLQLMALPRSHGQVQGHMGKRQADMWGAVPQHHQLAQPVQAQQLLAHTAVQAQAQAQALAQHRAHVQARAQAQAQVHGMRQMEPSPMPRDQMPGLSHANHVQAAHAQAQAQVSATLQAAQHAQHTQHAQHVQQDDGFSVAPLPLPFNPGAVSAAQRPSGNGAAEQWNRGAIAAVHMVGSPARPRGPRPQQPCPSSAQRMQPAAQPFRPTQILTRANSGRLLPRDRMVGQNEAAQESLGTEDSPNSLTSTHSASSSVPGLAQFVSLANLKISGGGGMEGGFWCGSPADHVLHPVHIKKHNPFGAVSSPRGDAPKPLYGPSPFI